MTDILLIAALVLLIVLIVMVILLLLKKQNAGTINEDKIYKSLSDNRVDISKDTGDSIKRLTEEITHLKEAITGVMNEAKQTNQTGFVSFLNATEKKLIELQSNFSKESSEVKHTNSLNIKDLIKQTTDDLNSLKAKILEEINKVNSENNKSINEQNLTTQKHINEQIENLKETVKKSLESGFEKNEKALHDFIEKTAKIEESTRQMESLRNEIMTLNNILNDKTARGYFGEQVLDDIFVNIYGEVEQSIFYRKQVNFTKEFGIKVKKGEEDVRVDFLLNLQTSHGQLPLSIDSKFPYSNYVRMLDDNLEQLEREKYQKAFKADVKMRIKEVTKYIIDGHTAPYAIMFIPAEAIFIEIFKNHKDLVESARSERVVIASPSLIITIIQIVQFILNDYQTRNNASEILLLIDKIGDEFRLFDQRWKNLSGHIESIYKDVKEIHITSKNLTTQFDQARHLAETQHLNAKTDDEVVEDTE